MRRFALSLLAVSGVFAVGTACDSERAIATDPIGAPAYGIRMNAQATNLPRGTAAFVVPSGGAADTIRLTLAGLDTLESGNWVIWATDTLGTNWRRLTGTLRVTRTDTVLNALGDPAPVSFNFTRTGVSAFKEGGPRNAMTFWTTRAQSGIPAAEQVGFLVVTQETDAAPTAPGTVARPLWFRRPNNALTAAASGNLSFGYFSLDPNERYVYNPVGQRGRVYVRGNIMLVNDSSLARPPRGFYYATYAVKRDDANTITDTLYFGAQTAPAPRRNLSLRNADVEIIDPLIQQGTPPQILAASNRIEAGTVDGLPEVTNGNPFRELATAIVSLELKSGKPDERLGPAHILVVDLPSIVRTTPTN